MIKPIIVAIFIAFLSLSLPLHSPSARQAPKQDSSRINGERCLKLDFRAVREQEKDDNRFILALETKQDCRECRIDQITAQIEMTRAICSFAVTFRPQAESPQPSLIEIDQLRREVILTGQNEDEMRSLFKRMCEQGGIAVALGEVIEVVYDENEIILEVEGGIVRKYTGPVPIWAHALVKDACQNQARSIVEVNPKSAVDVSLRRNRSN